MKGKLMLYIDQYGMQIAAKTIAEMAERFCSEDIVTRAAAWREVGEYWGFENLDSYPEAYTKKDLYRLFRKECYGKRNY